VDVNRREFIKIVGLGTAGLFVRTSVSSRADFWEHSGAPLSDEIAGLTMRVIGIGFAGCNMLDYILKEGLKNVDFIGASLDATFLEERSFPSKILLGESLGNPCGLGCDPALAYTYSMTSRETIRRRLEGSDLVIILAGMGGVTAAGGSPVVAQIGRDLGIWTIGIFTVPFRFEGKRRLESAQRGLDQLKSIIDTIVIPNNVIRPLLLPSATLLDGFRKREEISYRVVKAFSDILLTPSHSMDFTDIKRVFHQGGLARVSIGSDKGNGLRGAIQEAIRSPLLEGTFLEKARKVICNINLCGNETIGEIQDALCLIKEQSHKEADFLLNTQIDQTGKTLVTLIVGDFG